MTLSLRVIIVGESTQSHLTRLMLIMHTMSAGWVRRFSISSMMKLTVDVEKFSAIKLQRLNILSVLITSTRVNQKTVPLTVSQAEMDHLPEPVMSVFEQILYDPQSVYNLEPWEFEQLVADMLMG